MFAAILAGVFAGVMSLIMSIAFATLIFSGSLAPYIQHGIALAVSGSVIVGILGAILSGCRRVIFQPDDDTVPLYALLVATILASSTILYPSVEPLNLALASVLTATIVSGLTLGLMGWFRLGAIIEYLPYSVMGGYFAAAGWLLVVGSIKVLAVNIQLASVTDYIQLIKADAASVLAVFVIGFSIVCFRKKLSTSFLIPAVTLLSVILFYGYSFLYGWSVTDLYDKDYLLGPFLTAETEIFHPLWLTTHFDLIPTIFSSWEILVIIACLSALSAMLTMSGIALRSREDISMNSELTIYGVANAIAGLFGGMAALPSRSLTSLVEDVGAPKSRWVGALSVLFCLVFFLAGIEWIGLIPRIVIAGLLFYLGLSLLYEWLIESLEKYSFHEYLVIPTILLVAGFYGFLQGVLVGLIAAVILFVYKYSQIDVFKFTGDGTRFHSNTERSQAEDKVLRGSAHKVLVYGLEGYLFFGTAGSVYRNIKNASEEDIDKGAKFIVLDFSHVTGIDASASLNFEKLVHFATVKNSLLIIAGLSEGLQGRLFRKKFNVESALHLRFEKDLDHALEWCEDQLLNEADFDGEPELPFLDHLRQENLASYELFLTYLKAQKIEKGYTLTRQGDASDRMYFLDDCSASAFVREGTGLSVRVRKAQRGSIYGEIGFYLSTERSATVIADEPGRIFSLSRQSLSVMEREHPELSQRFQNYMLKMLVERLYLTTETLKAVLH